LSLGILVPATGKEIDRLAFEHRSQEQARHQASFKLETVDLADAQPIAVANLPTSFEVTGTTWYRASEDGRRATSFVAFVEEPTYDAGSNLTSPSSSTPIGVGQFVSDGLSGLAGIGIGVEGSVVGVISQAEPAPSDEESLAALAQQTNNPIGAAWLLITQNDTTLIGGDAIDGVKTLNVTKFMPVLSFPVLDDKWNLVVRPVFQYTSVPIDKDVGKLFGVSPNNIVADPELADIAGSPFGRTTGLGDTVLLTIAGPASDDGWIFAGGLSQIFPTATQDVLGQGKYQVGPAALVVRLGNDYGKFNLESFNIGALPQHWWSVAGDSDRASTSQTDIQYFINWKATPTQLIGMTPNISIDWKADGDFFDKAAIPVGIGTIGMFKIGRLPVRWGVEAQYYLTGGDDIRREANFRFFIAPIIPNLFK